MTEAGRELDVLIAKGVMGWKYVVDMDGRGWIDTRDGQFIDGYNSYDLDHDDFDPPPYSTDIAAAWEVVRHMESVHDYWMRLEYEASDWTGVDFIKVNGPIHRATGATAPLAICLAALKACGGGGPGGSVG